MKIDTTNMCSHLQRKLFEGEYRTIREQIETDPTLTAVVRGFIIDSVTGELQEICE